MGVFSEERVRARLAPDTIALMSRGLALLDHVPASEWMWEWTVAACEVQPYMGADVSALAPAGWPLLPGQACACSLV